MADLKMAPIPSDGQLREAMELLFFAYRDFTGEPDQALARNGYGRAHHRVIYFVGRHRGITVSELLLILRITKQSLSRVLRQLIGDGLVAQRAGADDRRKRHLELTAAGRALERSLSSMQMRRLSRAMHSAGPDAVEGFRRVMAAIVNEDDRGRFVADPGAH